MKIIVIYMCIALGQKQTIPRGPNYYINIYLQSLWSFALCFFPFNDFQTINAWETKFDLAIKKAKVTPGSSLMCHAKFQDHLTSGYKEDFSSFFSIFTFLVKSH